MPKVIKKRKCIFRLFLAAALWQIAQQSGKHITISDVSESQDGRNPRVRDTHCLKKGRLSTWNICFVLLEK